MKKTILVLVTLVYASVSFAQSKQNLISLSAGHQYMAQSGGDKALQFITTELSYRRALNKNIVLGFGNMISRALNTESGYSYTVASFVPKFEYYFNTTFNGFYLGTNLSFNNYSVSTSLNNNTILSISKGGATLGGKIGYALKLSDSWVADFSVNPGYDVLFESGEKGNFTNKTLVTLGYNF